jgi:VWFA-related protein
MRRVLPRVLPRVIKRFLTRFRSLLPLALICAACAPAQQTPPPAATTPPITLIPRSHDEREDSYRAHHRIILNVQVADSAGNPAVNRKPGDFTLLVDRQPHPVVEIRSVNGTTSIPRVHVILLLDAVNTTPAELTAERKAIETYLAQSQLPLVYPTAIAVLTDSGVIASPSVQDRGVLAAQLNSYLSDVHTVDCFRKADLDKAAPADSLRSGGLLPSATTPTGPSFRAGCLNQRFQRSVASLTHLAGKLTALRGRALLVWLGSGWPLLAGPDFSPDTPEIKRNFFDYLVKLSTDLRLAQLTLEAVSSPDFFSAAQSAADPVHIGFDPVATEDQASAASFALPVLVRQTGGQILTQSKDLANQIARSVADADSYYALTFDAPPAANPGQLHSIELRVANPALTVRTTTLYYAEP